MDVAAFAPVCGAVLARAAGVLAVTPGRSRASGTHHAGSDWDCARLTVGNRRVDVDYRDLDQVEHWRDPLLDIGDGSRLVAPRAPCRSRPGRVLLSVAGSVTGRIFSSFAPSNSGRGF